MVIASVPLWFFKYVFFPSRNMDTEAENITPSTKNPQPLWVRVVYGILCALSLAAIGLWLSIMILFGISLRSSGDDHGGGLGWSVMGLGFISILIMLYGMLPLGIILAIAYGIGATRAKD